MQPSTTAWRSKTVRFCSMAISFFYSQIPLIKEFTTDCFRPMLFCR
ncbi:unnamed protein product [Soboliphyme baturini]|uniref:Uncharacterized protein n=1 Tax=Soboliphyme baturini TaxID=241478 RepID=A0A183J706_9BILA|nr:unnamed protein product [Soboliphyme baturini]